jgi:hypothetical protein
MVWVIICNQFISPWPNQVGGCEDKLSRLITFSQWWNKKHGPEVHGLPVGKIFPVPPKHTSRLASSCVDSTSSLPSLCTNGLSQLFAIHQLLHLGLNEVMVVGMSKGSFKESSPSIRIWGLCSSFTMHHHRACKTGK